VHEGTGMAVVKGYDSIYSYKSGTKLSLWNSCN